MAFPPSGEGPLVGLQRNTGIGSHPVKAGWHLPSQPHSCLLGPWTFCPWARCWREEGTEVQRTVGYALLGWVGGSPLSYPLSLV